MQMNVFAWISAMFAWIFTIFDHLIIGCVIQYLITGNLRHIGLLIITLGWVLLALTNVSNVVNTCTYLEQPKFVILQQ